MKLSLFAWAPALMLSTLQVAKDARRQMLGASIRLAGGSDAAFFLDTPDRVILENVIFPYYQLSADHQAILFIGCDWYTVGYTRCFRLKNYATMDADPSRAEYGAERHQIASMEALGQCHPAASLDLIVCNGIVGWGLNDLADAEASFAAAYDALRPGGHLIIGWNDIDPRRPFALADIKALAQFERLMFPPLGQSQHRVDHKMHHVFDFYIKP